MSTTLTMALVSWPKAFVIQIGDSRCYHLRAGELRQVTTDQTIWLGAPIRQGALRRGIDRSVLSVPGSPDTTRPTSRAISRMETRPETRFSSAATLRSAQSAPRYKLLDLLGTAASATEAASALVGAALQGGGSDNVTVLAARFQS